MPLPSFPTLHPKPVTLPVFVSFLQHQATTPHPQTFLYRPSTPRPSRDHHLRFAILDTKEVSLHRCPLRCIIQLHHHLAGCRHRRCDRSLPSHPGAAITVLLSPRAGGPIASKTSANHGGISRGTGAQRLDRAAHPPHRERGASPSLPSDEVSTAHSHQQQQSCGGATAFLVMAWSFSRPCFFVSRFVLALPAHT